MKINSYRIKRFFSISTPSLSLPYQMALSVTSDREQFHLIMSFWSLEEKKRESVATFLFIFWEEGVSSGKFVRQGGFCTNMRSHGRSCEDDRNCENAGELLLQCPSLFFFFFWTWQ